MIRDRILEGLENFFDSKIESHVLNIEVLLDRGVGVAEHPDIMATIEGELDIIASYEDKRSCLKKYFL
jgi:hypothetical protein|tara:strand:- start:578 stop:781 length:204 start_codon:yes stop_codon:yes gene_type:complete